MIDGMPLVDVHIHAARLPTLKLERPVWAPFAGMPFEELYDADGTLRPDRFDAYLAGEGVDVALLMSEYSPKVTGIQTIEDNLPLVRFNPRRFHLIANVNPHYHHPIVDELERQLALGAVALKVHPVHGGFSPTEGALYPAYQRCAELGVPVVFHCGTSTFPGATNRYGDPALIDQVARDVPSLKVVLAHGGRGWWYDAAAFLAQARENVWIELSGLPPQRLPQYYAKYDLRRLARKFIFGSDWPGVPGIAVNARAVTKLDLGDEDDLRRVMAGNALEVYTGLELPPSADIDRPVR
jgi:uncharacterized protein